MIRSFQHTRIFYIYYFLLLTGLLSFVTTGNLAYANRPAPAPAPAPQPRHIPVPPHPDSHSHRNRILSTYLNCGFSDTKIKATQGDTTSQLDLGRCFYLKIGSDAKTFTRDLRSQPRPSISTRDIPVALEILNKSIYWLKKAAEKNKAEAQFYLAKAIYLKESIQYERKNKLELIEEKILSQWRTCLDNINKSAEVREAINKCRGLSSFTTHRTLMNKWVNWANDGIHENEFSEEAASWMRSAANSGHIRAQFELAQYLLHGTGIAIDFIEAQAWRIVAANQNPIEGNEIRYRLITNNWLTEEEQREANVLGRQYEKKYSDLWENPSVIIFHD